MCVCKYVLFFFFSCGSVVKNPPSKQKTHVQSLGWEDHLEKEMVTHSSILAWEIPQAEEHGGLQSTESQKNQTQLSNKTIIYMHRERQTERQRERVLLFSH